MAEGKNKIIVYRDWITTFDPLTDDEAGRLIKHFFRYVNDQNPEAPDRLTSLLFEPIKQTLKRDLRRYEKICLRNQQNGALGGRPKETHNNPGKPSGLKRNPNKPDNDSDSDSNINISFEFFWDAYDKKEDRVKCERKWNGLTDADREACMAAVPLYVRSTPDKKFRKNPATYLNNKSWTNEIISNPTSAARPYVPPQTPSYINKNYVQPV
jgi:hypothetical protein